MFHIWLVEKELVRTHSMPYMRMVFLVCDVCIRVHVYVHVRVN